ncbi:hypothetical protein JCGZ_11459 [Jatropha curcas]|uniref:PX domain-containing protein n=1 Tax=Jatropha curcas TaxID=180498 RepID=A0A067K7S5_JATCU|nr:uncharacterized protein LOC105640366 [Jatropha curcas]XP_020537613.1 uncharacterized protein LOC105640366 [Jatropha curcas]KDP31083.1 hypothetical protein JCGZ_11459 [Jatropha curcas]
MINGEGPHEDVSGTTSSDLFDSFPPKLSGGGDASPGSLSQYSSCGGESEFEKYCSANSVMGTPSFCGSFVPLNDFTESEFGSLRSLDGSLENFSLGGRLDRNMEEQKMSGSGLDCLKGNIKEGIAENGSNRLEMDDGEITCGESSRMNIGLGSRQECVNVGRNESDLSGSDVRNGLNFMSAGFDSEREMDGEEDGTSSRYEHSEADDSMYGCGSDDENRKSLYTPRNIQYCKEAKVENENPLLINTSVAFGSEDWDDFEQETGGGTLSSLSLNEFQEQKEQNFEAESSLVNSKSLATIGVPVVGLREIGEDVTAELPGTRLVEGNELVEDFNSSSVVPSNSQNSDLQQAEKVRDVPVAICQVQGTHEIVIDDKITPITSSHLRSFHKLEQEDVKDISVVCSLVEDANDRMEHFKRCSASDIFEMKQDPFVEKNHMGFGSNVVDCSMEREGLCEKSVDIIHVDGGKVLEKQETQSLELKPDPLSDSPNQLCSHPTEYFDNGSAEFIEDHKPNSARLLIESNRTRTMKNTPTSVDLSEDHPATVKADKVELDEFYDEIVNEMEEILLDSSESQGARFPQGNRMSQAQLSLPGRDGGSTASTSGAGDAFPQPLRIDGIEVVGAKQKKGDVSLSERLVGVKEFTVYVIRVWSGKDQWEVERRYRDFFTLYRRLKSLFTDQGWTLPLPWSSVEKESRKIFGNASPDVVSMRSVLIQECLHSIIHSRYFASPPSALLWFLCPQDSLPSSPSLQKPVPWSVFSNRGGEPGNISTLGKTISLVVEIRAYKSTKQLLEAQHYTCAGCHKHFDDGVTLVRDFVQVLGWGKPRLCEYTGQLFCSSCHTNETAVLPARVLHHWDFSHYPVSQLAKLYLDSIHEQPMLCVSAVNPFLFSKVPALQHIMSVRKRIGSMLPYVRCPFRRTINRGLGSRKYLLESNDFFALKDLIDLSKGAFAALPMMLETVSSKLLEHITDQCLICCDVGIPCSARQACNDPSSLIFPFQEGEIERCKSCESVFHKPCFKRLAKCTCGAVIGEEKTMEATNKLIRKASGLLGRRSSSGLSMGFLSGLFPRAKPETMNELKDHDTVILMGSLPSTSL